MPRCCSAVSSSITPLRAKPLRCASCRNSWPHLRAEMTHVTRSHSAISSLANLSLAVDQHLQGVTGDQSSPWTRAANTPNAMFGVGQQWADSVGQTADAWKNISAPATPGGPPPTAGQKTARVIRAVQQTAGRHHGRLGTRKAGAGCWFRQLDGSPRGGVSQSSGGHVVVSLHWNAACAHSPSSQRTILRSAPRLCPASEWLFSALACACSSTTCPPRASTISVWRRRAVEFRQPGSRSRPVVQRVHWRHPCRAPGGYLQSVSDGFRKRRQSPAGKVMAAIGKAAGAAVQAMGYAGVAVGALGMAADIAEAAVEDSEAMASAKALAAAMAAAQMAMDASKMAVEKTMWKDMPVVPPTGSIGAIIDPSHATVLIGGFPMINIPDPVSALLNRLSRYKRFRYCSGASANTEGAACH